MMDGFWVFGERGGGGRDLSGKAKGRREEKSRNRRSPNIWNISLHCNEQVLGESDSSRGGKESTPFFLPFPPGEREKRPTDLPTKKLILESNLWMEGGKGSKVGKVVLPAGYDDFLLFPDRQIDGGANTLFLY